RRREDRLREVPPDLARIDVEGRRELDVTDVIVAEPRVHEPGDERRVRRAPVVLDALNESGCAVADSDDRDANGGCHEMPPWQLGSGQFWLRQCTTGPARPPPCPRRPAATRCRRGARPTSARGPWARAGAAATPARRGATAGAPRLRRGRPAPWPRAARRSSRDAAGLRGSAGRGRRRPRASVRTRARGSAAA